MGVGGTGAAGGGGGGTGVDVAVGATGALGGRAGDGSGAPTPALAGGSLPAPSESWVRCPSRSPTVSRRRARSEARERPSSPECFKTMTPSPAPLVSPLDSALEVMGPARRNAAEPAMRATPLPMSPSRSSQRRTLPRSGLLQATHGVTRRGCSSMLGWVPLRADGSSSWVGQEAHQEIIGRDRTFLEGKAQAWGRELEVPYGG